jgi:hypothetical protein
VAADAGARAWIVEHLGEAVFERLASELRGSELQSVLLEVMARRAHARTPRELVLQYGTDPFCEPAPSDQRTIHAVDGHLLLAASAFEAVELSPVAPLGASSAVALTDQKRVLSALRATEVVSDPTNVLALECARRLRSDPRRAVHLATSQRVVRAQALPRPTPPGFKQHFRLFALASGGLEAKDHAFTVESVVLHAQTLLRALDRLESDGYAFGARRIDVFATPERRVVAERIVARLAPLATLAALEHPYYSGGIRYQIWVTADEGALLPLADGGVFDWLAKLTSNRRAVYVASGIGSQLMPLRFRRREGA